MNAVLGVVSSGYSERNSPESKYTKIIHLCTTLTLTSARIKKTLALIQKH